MGRQLRSLTDHGVANITLDDEKLFISIAFVLTGQQARDKIFFIYFFSSMSFFFPFAVSCFLWFMSLTRV